MRTSYTSLPSPRLVELPRNSSSYILILDALFSNCSFGTFPNSRFETVPGFALIVLRFRLIWRGFVMDRFLIVVIWWWIRNSFIKWLIPNYIKKIYAIVVYYETFVYIWLISMFFYLSGTQFKWKWALLDIHGCRNYFNLNFVPTAFWLNYVN